MNKSHRPDEDETIEAPQELIDALADLHNERIFVPPSIDEEIMAEARRRLKPVEAEARPSNILAWSGWGVAIAACAVLVFSLTLREPGRPESAEMADATPAEPASEAEMVDAAPAVAKADAPADAPAAFAREDVNGDRSVDILDAFALARRLEQPESVPAAWDFNNDGTIDRGDVDWIARVSVKL